VFESLRAAINAALDAATPDSDLRDVIGKMREAVVQARTSIELMREGVAKTEAAMAVERQKLADAERRGRLAAGIQDTETLEIADRFAAKHRERVSVLEDKLEAQRAELMLAEREYEEMKSQLIEQERMRPQTEASRKVESAWRDLEAAGISRAAEDEETRRLKREMERAAREARADQQLDELKKKMGKG
jgi:hypothetical protein